jgi:hypothetical protein
MGGCGGTIVQGGAFGRVGYAVLTCDSSTIRETGRDMVCEVRIYGGKNRSMLGDRADARNEVDCGFK